MKKDVRQVILEATMALMREQRAQCGVDAARASAVTMRAICARAGVGLGLINYHFGTKENLIALCVRQIVGEDIGRFDALPVGLDRMPPLQKLRFTVKATCDYMAENAALSREAILTDMAHNAPQDSTAQTMAACFPLVREVCGAKADESEPLLKTYLLTLSLQGLFLRMDPAKRELGLDFADKQQRDAMIDAVIGLIL